MRVNASGVDKALCSYRSRGLPNVQVTNTCLGCFGLSSVLVTEDSTWDSCYEIIRTDNGFSNSGMRTTTSTLAIVYWYAALIKI